MNILLKMKFREPNYEYLIQTASRTVWPYQAMLDRLELGGRDWKLVSTPIPWKIIVVYLDVVPKKWMYFLRLTLDTNRSGSKFITTKALALYLLLAWRLVNVWYIIYADMHEMAQSATKKSLGYASVILLLCRKVGMEKFTYGRIMNPIQTLDARWIPKHLKRVTRAEEVPTIEEHSAETVGPRWNQPHHAPGGVTLANKDSQADRDMMSMFCFMQNFSTYIGLLGSYLTHLVDTRVAARRFWDIMSGDPPTPFYGRYHYPGMETPIQFRGPI